MTCGELFDDLLEHADHKSKPSTAAIWRLVIDANLRPFFGKLKAALLTTAKLIRPLSGETV